MNPFDQIADGYARHRPPVHGHILRRALAGWPTPVGRALDVGCGSGVSTLALTEFARERIGVEPAASMVAMASEVDPGARFLQGTAEEVPWPDGAADLITAAGALNYANLGRFFPEALRLLAPGGALLVYDFSTGNRRDSDWLSRFIGRYPWAPSEARHLDPEILAREANGFTLHSAEQFAVSLTLSRAFYLDYMLTETNVAYAVRQGGSLAEVRAWCDESLWPDTEAEILFPGYYALFQRSV
ncbi:MAG: methyltransferase domain-containing protein [Bryobacteraceae bacterium]|nr:methyltransferase domain-containing protein [Bryobacteraceae bacterium]